MIAGRGNWAHLFVPLIVAISGLMFWSPHVGANPSAALTTVGITSDFFPSDKSQENADSLTLEAALAHAADHHPKVIEAKIDQEAARAAHRDRTSAFRPQLNVRTDVAWFGVTHRDDAWKTSFESGFIQERPIHIGSVWHIPGGPSLTAGAVVQQQSKMDSNVDAFNVSSRWNLWPGDRADDNLYAWRVTADHLDDDEERRIGDAIQRALIDTYGRYRRLQVDRWRWHVHMHDLARRELLLEAAEARAQRGVVSSTDLTTARIERDRAQAAVERAEAHYTRQLRAFAKDLGVDETSWSLSPLPDRLEHVSWDLSEKETVQKAIDASLVYAAAQRDLEAARRRVDLAQKDNGLSASLTTGVTVKRWSESPEFATFIRVEYDLLDGGRRQVKLSQAHIDLTRARDHVDTIRADIRVEVSRRIVDLQWMEKEVSWARQAYDMARELSDTKEQQWQQDMITYAELMDYARSETESLIEWMDAYTEYEIARLHLLNMAGLPLDIEGIYFFER